MSKNKVETEALPALIQMVFRSLAKAGEAEAPAAPAQMPAVPVKRSVFPDHIICLEDGKKLKMLKRHLQTSYNMTPEAYRTKWGLPKDYPMVAPTYAARRSQLAKNIGLGLKPKAALEDDVEPEVDTADAHAAASHSKAHAKSHAEAHAEPAAPEPRTPARRGRTPKA